MSEHEPTHEFHDELLSAYLDGELSADERARVEERLAVDPVARQTLDDLRSVSQAVRGLPVKAVGEDLRPAILERAKLATSAAPSTSAPAARVQLSNEGGAGRFSIGHSRRGWFWAALAVAAALVVMFVDRSAEDEAKRIDVAANSSGRSEPAANKPASSEAPMVRSREVDESTKLADSRGAEAPTYGMKENVPELRLDGSTTIANAPAAPATAQSRELELLKRGSGEGRIDSQSDVFDLTARATAGPAGNKDSAPPIGGSMVDQNNADQKNLVALDELKRDAQMRDSTVGKAFTQPFDVAKSALEGSGDSFGARSSGSGNEKLTDSTSGGVPIANSLQAGVDFGEQGEPSLNTDGMLIVYVNVKRAAFDERAFDRRLESQRIAYDAPLSQGRTAVQRQESLNGEQSARFRANDDTTVDATEPRDNFKADDKNASPPLEALLVEAPAEQINGLLKSLDADSDNVLSVSVDGRALVGKDAALNQLSRVDWSGLGRVAVPEELRMTKSRPSESTLAYSELSTSSETTNQAVRRAGRGRRGGAAPAGGGRGGGGGGVVARGGGAGGRAGFSGEVEATGQPKAGAAPAIDDKSVGEKGGGERAITKAEPSNTGSDATKAPPTAISARLAQSQVDQSTPSQPTPSELADNTRNRVMNESATDQGAAGGGMPDRLGGMGMGGGGFGSRGASVDQRILGRALRVDLDRLARESNASRPSGSNMGVEQQFARKQSAAEENVAEHGANFGAKSTDGSLAGDGAARPANNGEFSSQLQSGEPRGARAANTTTTPPAEPARSMAAIGGPATSGPQPAAPLRVLFVLRAMPDAATDATPKVDAPTSPAASNPAK